MDELLALGLLAANFVLAVLQPQRLDSWECQYKYRLVVDESLALGVLGAGNSIIFFMVTSPFEGFLCNTSLPLVADTSTGW